MKIGGINKVAIIGCKYAYKSILFFKTHTGDIRIRDGKYERRYIIVSSRQIRGYRKHTIAAEE